MGKTQPAAAYEDARQDEFDIARGAGRRRRAPADLAEPAVALALPVAGAPRRSGPRRAGVPGQHQPPRPAAFDTHLGRRR